MTKSTNTSGNTRIINTTEEKKKKDNSTTTIPHTFATQFDECIRLEKEKLAKVEEKNLRLEEYIKRLREDKIRLTDE
ncbi:hypothetical protein Pmar_PMAR022490 [Perkinsus marinus ATCC 50983]|uniref:Uncharacterized protein n=1 Tax=Perkinsus marinus (strain ATCC 50983 / TXsc) TaxID=423536 RepID=C5KNE2_PERM5|nr:hypothetical protein Pmar_PMAR022490 [Perkinsus marinus ATCC 50983]EER13957.1 hypothetical protein Pmar_PMAR022490 [Perkinsus marinus ATCC 50983]|eukprot:XP_002782162.1 hypothetical protein Pmar_PMAR022490 [Perkinsus marinus ATCC 50983]